MVLVIGAGLPRTGTSSLRDAFSILKLGPTHHMVECLKSKQQSQGWAKVLKQVNEGQEPDAELVKSLLADFPTSCDSPSADIWEHLVRIYPDAKVVLTLRPPSSWWSSMTSTVMRVIGNRVHQWMVYWVPNLYHQSLLGDQLHKRWMQRYGSVDEGMMDKRTAEVKAGVDPTRLLVFQPKDGWQPLCDFLGVPVPDVPFPHSNDGEAMGKVLKAATIMGLRRWLMMVTGVVATSVAVAYRAQLLDIAQRHKLLK